MEEARPAVLVAADGPQVNRGAAGRQQLGVTPWNATHPAAPGKVALHLRRTGYSDAAVVLDLATDTAQVLTLSHQSTLPGKNPLPRPRGDVPRTGHSSAAPAGRIGYEP